MKRQWSEEELVGHFTIPSEEHRFIRIHSRNPINQLGLALMLKFFQYTGSYPDHLHEIPDPIINHVRLQLELDEEPVGDYDWKSRTATRHRAVIRDFLGFRIGGMAHIATKSAAFK